MLSRRSGHTTAVTISAERFYLTANQRDDGSLGEVFIHWGKHGTSGAGLVSTYAIALSMGLAHRVPLAELIRPGLGQYFMPNGRTDDPEIPRVWSAVDYIARRLALDWLPYSDRAALGVYTQAERVRRGQLAAGAALRGYVALQVQAAQEVPGGLRRFLADLPGDGSASSRGYAPVLGAGFGFDSQAGRDVHAELVGPGSRDVPELVLLAEFCHAPEHKAAERDDARHAGDAATAARLWSEAEHLTGVALPTAGAARP